MYKEVGKLSAVVITAAIRLCHLQVQMSLRGSAPLAAVYLHLRDHRNATFDQLSQLAIHVAMPFSYYAYSLPSSAATRLSLMKAAAQGLAAQKEKSRKVMVTSICKYVNTTCSKH